MHYFLHDNTRLQAGINFLLTPLIILSATWSCVTSQLNRLFSQRPVLNWQKAWDKANKSNMVWHWIKKQLSSKPPLLTLTPPLLPQQETLSAYDILLRQQGIASANRIANAEDSADQYGKVSVLPKNREVEEAAAPAPSAAHLLTVFGLHPTHHQYPPRTAPLSMTLSPSRSHNSSLTEDNIGSSSILVLHDTTHSI